MTESPIFIKTFDMLVWLMKHTQKFPARVGWSMHAKARVLWRLYILFILSIDVSFQAHRWVNNKQQGWTGYTGLTDNLYRVH